MWESNRGYCTGFDIRAMRAFAVAERQAWIASHSRKAAKGKGRARKKQHTKVV